MNDQDTFPKCVSVYSDRLAYVLFLACGAGAFFYEGNIWLYLMFCAVFTAVLRQAFHGDFKWSYFYLACFMFLAFPLKLASHLILHIRFSDLTGYFAYSPSEFDGLITVAGLGGGGIILAKFIFDKIRWRPLPGLSSTPSGSGDFRLFSTIFIPLALALAAANSYWGFFRIGMLSDTVLPFKLTSLIFWAFNFGIIFFLAYTLNLPGDTQKQIDRKIYLAIFLGFVVSLTTFSRGSMFFISIPFILATLVRFRSILAYRSVFKYITIWIIVLLVTLPTVSRSRSKNFIYNTPLILTIPPPKCSFKPFPGHIALLDRWVGLEGLATVQSHPGKSWTFFRGALLENLDTGPDGIYQKISGSPFSRMSAEEKSKFTFGSPPGFMAFLLYSGSIWLVFAGTFFFVFFMLSLERFSAFMSRNNVFLSSVVGCSLANLFMQFAIPKMALIHVLEILATLFLYKLAVDYSPMIFEKIFTHKK